MVFIFFGITLKADENRPNASYRLVGEHLNVVIEAGKTNRIEYLKNLSGYDFRILNNSNSVPEFSLKPIEEANGRQLINSISGSQVSIRDLNGKYLLSINNSERSNNAEYILEFIPVNIQQPGKNKDEALSEEPDSDLWINNGAIAADGRIYNCRYQQQSWSVSNSNDSLQFAYREDKVIVMDRFYQDGTLHNPDGYGGDILASHVNDLRGKYGTWLNFNLKRGASWSSHRGLIYQQLNEPEWLVTDVNGEILRQPDRIIVEMIAAHEDSLFQLTNVPDSLWRKIPARHGREASNNSYLTIYGGGGYERGTLFTDPDSVLNAGDGIVLDPFDIGSDDFFHPWIVPVPDTLIKRGFLRFRFRVDAKDNSNGSTYYNDDPDYFILDNIDLTPPVEGFDVQAIALVPDMNFIFYPLSHPFEIPLKAYIHNKMQTSSPELTLVGRVSIGWDEFPEVIDPESVGAYGRKVQIPPIPPGALVEVEFPPVPIRGQNIYPIYDEKWSLAMLNIEIPGGDIDISNDTVFTQFKMFFDSFFGYDIANGNQPRYLFGDYGLSLPGYSSPYNEEIYQIYGGRNGPGGEIAVKFPIFEKDTVAGFQLSFAKLINPPSEFELAIYTDENGMPGEVIDSTVLLKIRGKVDEYYREMGNYYYGIKDRTGMIINPPILEKGDYWAVIRQLDDTPINLGYSAVRNGMKVMQVDTEGEGKNNINIFYNASRIINEISNTTGMPVCSNKTIFAYRNEGDEEWTSFSPTIGNPGYGSRDISGRYAEEDLDTLYTYSRGTFAPVLRILMDPGQIPVGIEDSDIENDEISFYPNPASDYIRISNNDCIKTATVEIYDMQGNRMNCSEISAGVYDIRNLIAGPYIFIVNKGGDFHQEIIIKD